MDEKIIELMSKTDARLVVTSRKMWVEEFQGEYDFVVWDEWKRKKLFEGGDLDTALRVLELGK